MPHGPDTVQRSVTIDQDLAEWIEALAASEHRSWSQMTKVLLAEARQTRETKP